MKFYSKLLYIGCLPALMSLGSCNKGFLNVNSSPNNVAASDAPAALLFTGAISQTATIVNGNGTGNSGGDFENLMFPMNYESLNTNYQVAFNITRNNYTSNDFTGVWGDCYHVLNDYQTVLATATGSGEPFLEATAKVMIALHFQILVDAYGNVPYAQSLQLATGITNPAYDSAQTIYTACINKLDSAITILEGDSVNATGAYNPGSADIVFAGSAQSWVQLANTLKLRMLLHEINVTGQQSFIQAEAAKIASDPNGCLGAGQTAYINPGYATDLAAHLNPFWSSYGYTITAGAGNPDQSANQYVINKLTGYNDPRVAYFYCVDGAGGYSGNAFGIPSNANSSYVGSGPGPTPGASTGLTPPFGMSTTQSTWGLCQAPTQPAILLSSWESLFLQAEAIERGLLPGGDAAAQADYQQAITDNFTYLNVFTDGVTNGNSASSYAQAYYSQSVNLVGWTASSNKIQAIIEQKYISNCLTDVEEAWTDFRRLGYPSDLPLSNDPASTYPRVTRFIYPQSEYNTNAQNVQGQGTITPAGPKIFWMP